MPPILSEETLRRCVQGYGLYRFIWVSTWLLLTFGLCVLLASAVDVEKPPVHTEGIGHPSIPSCAMMWATCSTTFVRFGVAG